jgi:hypothetical protein
MMIHEIMISLMALCLFAVVIGLIRIIVIMTRLSGRGSQIRTNQWIIIKKTDGSTHCMSESELNSDTEEKPVSDISETDSAE